LRLVAERRVSARAVEVNVALELGDMLIAACSPIEAKCWWEAKRSVDHWHIGIRHRPVTSE